jgi:hypothetical protein
VEGINIGGFLILYLSLFVFGIGSLAAVGLWIGRLHRAALLTFASGQLLSALIAVFATLTFLDRQFHGDENTGMILLIATILLLAGSGQFIAAIRCPRYYGAALACGAGSMLFLAGRSFGADWIGVSGLHFQSRPGMSLLLAVACLVIGLLPPRRRTSPLLWTALGGLGVIAGVAVSDLVVASRCQLLEPPGARVSQVRVEIYLLGLPISEASGLAQIPDDGPGSIRFLTLGQALLIFTTQFVFAAGGIYVALAIGAKLVKQATEQVPAAPPSVSEDYPPIHGYSSEQIKRM